ncbi:hypothetical protein KC316_g1303 [Hortaea werneckii]|nr:hypothetical protein KC324_g2362 [Hortaea werneckii]KAI7594135.1 hypothetical protein KC316_g1303 [Hortaea werneckii]
MQSHAADQAKAAMADLMSIARWKAPHASAVAWQAGLDEIDRFYRSDVSHSTTGPQPTEGYDGRSHEYNPQQAGSNGPQSVLGLAHEKPLSLSRYKVPHPVSFELTVKQNGAPVLQQGQAAESLPHPDSLVPIPANKLPPPHASSSLGPENMSPLPELKQDALFTEVEPSAEPSQTQHQPPSDTVESHTLQPPTQQAEKAPSAQSQSAFPLLKSAQRDPSSPLLPKPHEWPPLQQNPQWNSVGDITVRPKWTLEPPPPPGLQPAFEGEGKAPVVGATGEGSQVAIPLREKLEKTGSSSGAASVSGEELVEGDERRKEGFSVGNKEWSGDGAVGERRLEEVKKNVMERDQGADLTACQKEKSSDRMRSDLEDDAKGSAPNGDAAPAIRCTSAPDTVTADEEHEREESNERTDALQRDSNEITQFNPQDQTVPATDPHANPNTLTTNPPRRSPTNSRTFSNARDEIASLNRRRENSSSTRSSSSNAARSASSPLPPAKKKKKNPHHAQTSSISDAGAEASEQKTLEVSNPEDGTAEYVSAPTPADQEIPVNTAVPDPPAPDLLSVQPAPSSAAKGKQNQTHETEKRKRSPRRAMSKRELTNLEGTTVEGKLRRRGVQERQEQSQPQSQIQMQQQQKQRVQRVQQVPKERKGQKGGQEEEGKEKGKGKGEQKEAKQGKGKESPANADGAARRKRQRRS